MALVNRDKDTYNTSGILSPQDRICHQCGAGYQGIGNSKYCSKKCGGMNSYEANMLKYPWRLNKLMAMAKNRAKTKSIPFDLTLQHLEELWEEGGGCCALSGIPLELGRSEFGKVHPYAPSLDREVPSLGYTRGNVRIVCYQMNVALSEFGISQFEELVRRYSEFQKGGVAFK
jgi:hypothetical protein